MADRAESRAPIAFEAERRRLQRLARALLREEASAEDAVQEAWLALLRIRDDAPRDPSAWLAATVRRLAQGARREAARRARRERAVARAEGVAPADEAAERIEVLRRVLDAVEALEEPYRGAIVRRFLDGLPPRAIARERGQPVATVRTHVRRGLERLRQALDARCGDERSRERFLSALAPVAGAGGWSITAALEPLARGGAFAMKWRAVSRGVCVCALLAGGVAGWSALRGEREPSGELAPISAGIVPERARPAGAAPPTEDAAAGAEARTALAQEHGFVVRGTVVTPARTEPLPEVPLSLRLAAATGELLAEGRARADADGRFAWSAPAPPTRATLAIRAVDDALRLEFERVLPAGGLAPEDLLLVAYPMDVVLAGRVLDPELTPVAGALVKTWSAEARTDAAGRFRLRASSRSGRYPCRIVAPGFAILRSELSHREAGEWPAGDLVLRRAVPLRGILRDPGGAPIAGAQIRSVYEGDHVVATDTEGRFAVDWLAADPRWSWLEASARGFATQRRGVSEAELVAGALEWTLARGAAVSGVVRHEAGAPVPDARVVAGVHPDGDTSVAVFTDAEGRYELPLLRPGELTVWVERDGYVARGVEVSIPAEGAPLTGVDLVLTRGDSLAGHVVDEAGAAVPFAFVYWNGPGDWLVRSRDADADGRFRFDALPPAPAALGFLHRGFVRHEQSFEQLGRDDVVVRLRRAGALAGRVVDGETGAPIPSFRIRFVASSEALGRSSMAGFSVIWAADRPGAPFEGTDGYWSTAGTEELTIGARTGVEALAEGYGSTVVDAVVEAEPDPDALVIELFAADGALRGQVVASETGGPLEGARVEAFRGRPSADAEAEHSATTDRAGRFELRGLPRGVISLLVEHPGYSRAVDGPFELGVGDAVSRLVALDRASRVHGRLFDAAGASLPDAKVLLLPRDDELGLEARREQRTDARGAFAFEDVGSGAYQLTWQQELGGESAYALSRLVTVEPGAGSVEVDLRPLGAAVLRGTIHGEEELVRRTTVMLRPAASGEQPDEAERLERSLATRTVDGRFVLEGVPRGRYLVIAHAGMEASARLEVDVPADGELSIVLELARRR